MIFDNGSHQIGEVHGTYDSRNGGQDLFFMKSHLLAPVEAGQCEAQCVELFSRL